MLMMHMQTIEAHSILAAWPKQSHIRRNAVNLYTVIAAIDFAHEFQVLLTAVVYALVGILLLMIGYLAFDALTPTKMNDKIFKEGNIAVAIVLGCFLLGLAIVIHGAFSI